MTKCFECKKDVERLIRFMCDNCYQIKYRKNKIPINQSHTSNWICDCPSPENDLQPPTLLVCPLCKAGRGKYKIKI